MSDSKLRSDLNRQTLVIYWRHATRYSATLVLCALGIITLIGSDIFSPLIYKKFFDLLDSASRTDNFQISEIKSRIFWIAVLAFVNWAGWRLCMYTIIRFESSVMADLAVSSFKYLQNHSHRFFTDNFAGALVKRVNRFSAGFEVIADQCTLQLGQVTIRIFLILGILIWQNLVIGLVFMAWTVTFILFNIQFSRYKLKFDMRRAEMDTRVTAQLADTIANSINLKLFSAINREVRRFSEIIEEHRAARFKAWKLGEISEATQGISVRVLEIVMLAISVKFWRDGTLTLGTIVMLRSYMWQLAERVREVGQSVRRIYEAMADANEMSEILCTPHEITDKADAVEHFSNRGEVSFRRVQFSYLMGTNMVLRDFNLNTKSGERIGIVGPSGGGKSTILKLLIRLYEIDAGEILLGGIKISQLTQDSLRKKIAFVPQDSILFHRSLMENIRYSRPEATDQEVIEAAKLAHCHEFISAFPQGYETLVGERGIKLSGGERQRVAIARAILMNAPILVLDEATSSLDSESELFIQDSLSKLMVGRTVIAVAHRLSTIRKMDRIIVVKDGTIVEEGHHDLLLKMEDGHYQKLWNLQSAGLTQ